MAAIVEGTVGTNITYGNDIRVWKGVLNALNRKANEGPRGRKVCIKAGPPASNTVDDNPRKLYDICWDTTNNEVYMCTTYFHVATTSTGTVWTKITD